MRLVEKTSGLMKGMQIFKRTNRYEAGNSIQGRNGEKNRSRMADRTFWVSG